MLVDAYLNDRIRSGELAESSAGTIRRVLEQWHRQAPTEPADWTVDHVAAWVNHGNSRPNTRKSRLTKLRPYLRWLIAAGVIDRNPSDGIRRIHVPKGTPRDMARWEIAALLAACPDARAVLIVLLMLQCGLRCGDVARIRVEDVDARRRVLNVRGKGGRGEPTHWVAVPDEAWGKVVAHLRSLGRSAGPLIESQRHPGVGITPHSVSKLVGTWIRDAGLKEFPHDGKSAHAARHTCAQDMLDNGADLREVQFALGHSTVRSTEIYTRREPPGLREAMEGRRYLDAA